MTLDRDRDNGGGGGEPSIEALNQGAARLDDGGPAVGSGAEPGGPSDSAPDVCVDAAVAKEARTRTVATEAQLILKWGGVLTRLGRSHAEALGRSFREEMYPGVDGLMRLHTTYRHDLKIYSSARRPGSGDRGSLREGPAGP